MSDPHLTVIPGLPCREDIVPGMAHFAGSGPEGETCGGCEHRGVRRGRRVVMACAMFRKLTGRNGPVVACASKACKYFTPSIYSIYKA